MGKERARSFSGEVDTTGAVEDPGVWLRHYLRVCQTRGWTTDEQKLAHVAMSLTGEAEAWYDVHVDWIETEDTE